MGLLNDLHSKDQASKEEIAVPMRCLDPELSMDVGVKAGLLLCHRVTDIPMQGSGPPSSGSEVLQGLDLNVRALLTGQVAGHELNDVNLQI